MFPQALVDFVTKCEEDAIKILDLRVGYNYRTEDMRRKVWRHRHTTHTGIYNLGGISPQKKLCLLDLCRGERLRCTRLLFFFLRKTGDLSTKNGWQVNYENSCKPEETYCCSVEGDIRESKLFNKSAPEKALVNMRIV